MLAQIGGVGIMFRENPAVAGIAGGVKYGQTDPAVIRHIQVSAEKL